MKLASPTEVRAVQCRELQGSYDAAAALVRFAAEPGAFALESVCNTTGFGRFTIMGCAPITMLDRAVGSSPIEVEHALSQLSGPMGVVRVQDETGLPFAGGWIGYFPYEVGAVLERVPTVGPPTSSARIRFALYDGAVIQDHRTGRWHACAVDLPGSREPASRRSGRLAELLGESQKAARDRPFAESEPIGQMPASALSRPQYLERVRRIIRYIEAGDVYQVNLTQPFVTHTTADPLDLYLRLRRSNPADFAGYLPWGRQAVLSCSPELFLDLRPDGVVVTRPIKGTRARDTGGASDRTGAAQLLASDKDRAELNMIIDLLRNDLGKVCTFGSVEVVSDCDVEVHPTVLHLVSTIRGRLRDDVSLAELLRATLPGGSVTGCPKIRAMQIIHELEPFPRGVYCGAIGLVGLDGRLILSVAIRTMFFDAGELRIHAGGAITADSDPEEEYLETLAKAEGMFRALGHSTDALRDACLPPSAFSCTSGDTANE